MNEQSRDNKSNRYHRDFGIICLVLSIVTIIFSFVPCFGMYGMHLGGGVLIFSVTGFIIAFKDEDNRRLFITSIVLVTIGIYIAYQNYLDVQEVLDIFTK